MAIRFLTAGESHGQCLSGILEGVPAGYKLDFDFINSELSQRQKGFGRGGRMKIETDKIIVKSGIRFSETTASPIAFEIKNKDWQNWVYPMSVEELDYKKLNKEAKNKIKEKIITHPRPAHADLPGIIKYNFDDIRYVLERSSARETATRVATGAICQNILQNYGITFSSEVLSIGKCENKKEFKEYIAKYADNGDTLGGTIKITVKNVPYGLGSFTHWDKKLDGKLAQALMSIPSVKSVEVGLGKEYAKISGSNSHDEIYYKNGKYLHKTNNSGGIEGGMTNGEDIILIIGAKPIPTMKKPLHSVEIKTHKNIMAHYERADNCAVHACGIVAKNMCAIILLDAFLDKFGSDCKCDIDKTFKQYQKRIDAI